MVPSTQHSTSPGSWFTGLSRWNRQPRAASTPAEFGHVLDQLAEGFLVVDDRQKILFANQAVADVMGIAAESLVGQCMDSLGWCSSSPHQFPWHVGCLRHVGQQVISSRANELPIAVGGEQLMLLQRGGGCRRLLAITVRPFRDSSINDAIVISLRDATGVETYRAEMEGLLARVRHSREEMQTCNEQLRHLATKDALTGCRNRGSLDEQIQTTWHDSIRDDKPLTCMMIDIDHFKSFNDNHGHATGDEVLRRVGQTLREAFAGVGQVYRYGGEEFCVLLPGHDLQAAGWIGERVRASISDLQIPSETASQAITDQSLRVTVSIGVNDRQSPVSDAAKMLNGADQCLYMAKRRGRNCVVIYGPEIATAQFRSSDRSLSPQRVR